MEAPFKFHPLANLFPLIEGTEFLDLVEDVRKNGVLEPVSIYNWEILDGRNRYRAAKEAGVACPFVAYGSPSDCNVTKDYDGNGNLAYTAWHDEDFSCDYGGELANPVGFVVSKNLKRRHLTESQRAMVAATLANLEHGGDRSKPSIEGLSTDNASNMLNVGRASVERGKTVQRDGAPELIHAVEQGDVAVSAAAEFAKQSKEDQSQQIVDAGSPTDAVKAFRDKLPTKKQADKLAIELKDETGHPHAVLGKDGKYHSGATDAEREAGDLYLTMASAIRSVIALNQTASVEQLISTITPQSRVFFPQLFIDAERVLDDLKTEWIRVHVKAA